LFSFVFTQTHSAGWVSAATAGRFIPALLFSPYGGVVAERFECVRLMIGLDLLSSACMASLPLVVVVNGPVIVAIAVGAAAAVTGVTYEPALAALVPQLVPEDELAAANSVRGLVDNGAVIVGPAIGAVVVGVGGGERVHRVHRPGFSLLRSAGQPIAQPESDG
jgi:MFS family permease